ERTNSAGWRVQECPGGAGCPATNAPTPPSTAASPGPTDALPPLAHGADRDRPLPPAPDTQDTTVIPWSYWDMEIVKPVAEPAAAATPPDDAPRPGLVSRLAAWCTTESAAQDRDPTVW